MAASWDGNNVFYQRDSYREVGGTRLLIFIAHVILAASSGPHVLLQLHALCSILLLMILRQFPVLTNVSTLSLSL